MASNLPRPDQLPPGPDSARAPTVWSWAPARERVWPSGAAGTLVRELATRWNVTGARPLNAPASHNPLVAGDTQVEGWRVTVEPTPPPVWRVPDNVIRLDEGQIVSLG